MAHKSALWQRRMHAFTASALALTATPAWAQEAPAGTVLTVTQANGQEIYQPEFFTAFGPRTALDMVNQLPGFTIVSVNNGGDRGLGAARENILINGERIASKSLDARTALSRITAANVVRIEVMDGASLNVPGLTGQVANIITRETGFTRTIRWQPVFRKRFGAALLNGEISTTGPTGLGQLTVSLANDMSRDGRVGPEIVRDGFGNLLFRRDEIARFNVDSPTLSLALADKAENGNALNINAKLQYFKFTNSTDSDSIRPAEGLVEERFSGQEKEWNGEFGANYDFSIGKGRMKLISLYSFENSPFVDTFVITRPSGITGNRFRFTGKEDEAILRSEYSWKTASGHDWQLSLEGAYNRLGVLSELDRRAADGNFLVVPGSRENTVIDERRADFIITHGRRLAPNLTLQANIGGEYSALSQTGSNGLTRQFIRPKGKLAFSWKASPRLTVNYEIQRRVDQLDFFDFASSTDLVGGQNNQGNVQLVPPQVWRTQLESIFDLGPNGNLTLQAAYARAEDLVDQIPLSSTTEGRGNLPVSHLYRVTAKGSLLFDPMGWKGAMLDFNASLRRNRVRDPLTGQWRNQSFGETHVIEVALRHDVPQTPFAWGVSLTDQNRTPGIRLNEITEQVVDRPDVTAFIEHKNIGGLKVNASVFNILGLKEGLSRIIYEDRRDGPVAFTERRERRFGPVLLFTVSGQI